MVGNSEFVGGVMLSTILLLGWRQISFGIGVERRQVPCEGIVPMSPSMRHHPRPTINAMADDTRPAVFIFSGSPVAAQVYAFRRCNFPESLFYDFEGIALVTRRQPDRFRPPRAGRLQAEGA